MFRTAVSAALLVQARCSSSACAAAGAAGACPPAAGGGQTQGAVWLQRSQKLDAHSAKDPSWWAPPQVVAEHDHQYRRFVNYLLQETVLCEDNASFVIEAKAVDSQHQKLYALVDQVRQLLLEKQGRQGFDDGLKLTGEDFKPLKTLLVWLKQYTVVHFDAEEQTMLEVAYMDMVEHKALHRAFYGHVMMWSEIVDEMMRNNGTFHVGNVFVMVAKWLQDHICVQDKRVAAFVEKSTQKDPINMGDSADAVDDVMPDCVPALVGEDNCVALLQEPQPASPAPEWWAPEEQLTAHDHWYRAFVHTLLRSPVVCELSDSFDVSVKAVDAQHHKLLSLIDEVRTILYARQERLGYDDGLKLTGDELEPLRQVVTWLHQYGIVHFDAEEHTMELLGFPNLAKHQALHRAFYGQMMMATEVVNNMMSFGGGFHVGPIYVFMVKWIQDHVCVLDKAVGQFISRADVDLNETEDIIPDMVHELRASTRDF